jgi:hypothetical protein
MKKGLTAFTIASKKILAGASLLTKCRFGFSVGFTKIGTLFKSAFTFLGAVSPWV